RARWNQWTRSATRTTRTARISSGPELFTGKFFSVCAVPDGRERCLTGWTPFICTRSRSATRRLSPTAAGLLLSIPPARGTLHPPGEARSSTPHDKNHRHEQRPPQLRPDEKTFAGTFLQPRPPT